MGKIFFLSGKKTIYFLRKLIHRVAIDERGRIKIGLEQNTNQRQAEEKHRQDNGGDE
jgi:hypothetical protein